MTTHIGAIETSVELTSEAGPALGASERSPVIDERSRLMQALARARALARRTRAEGLSDD
jgi:hypothetical protein